jgi:prepilin-type N-terminal cleavage/methylation domain-containing protein
MKSTQPIGNRQSKTGNGFTLIEIMLVVVIILIVTGVAVPKLSGSFSSTRMKDAVRSTVRVARYARSMAILEQADCELSFADNRITLTTKGNTNNISAGANNLRGSVTMLAQRRLPDEIKITEFENLAENAAEGRKAVFYSSGMNDGFELTLEDDKKRRATIKCNPITGKVKVEE